MSSRLLHLLRHGEPVRPGRLLGRTDDAVTVAGIAACVDRARGLEHGRLVTSNLRRASDCADAIGRADPDSRWRELDFGEWDGAAPAEVDAEALSRFWSDPDQHPPPGGERWSSLLARVSQALDALPPVPTLVVTHGGPMRAALCRLCGLDLAAAWSVHLPYAALLSFRVWDRGAQLVGLRT